MLERLKFLAFQPPRLVVNQARQHSATFRLCGQPQLFHSRLSGYSPTPIIPLPELAKQLGLSRLYAKYEGQRFGLPSFKPLGAMYAALRLIESRFGPVADLAEARRILAARPDLTLVAATDGNHGRAVARIAALLGTRATIFVPNDINISYLQPIYDEKANICIVQGDYDAAVEMAASAARAHGAFLISDTGLHVEEESPNHVLDGYTTLFAEIDGALGRDAFDSLILPAGVGGLAAAAVKFYRSTERPHSQVPLILTVEPERAACVQASIEAGRIVKISVTASAMSCLQCGTVSCTAWPYLYRGLDAAISVVDSWCDPAITALRSVGIHTRPTGAAALAGVLAVFLSSAAASWEAFGGRRPDSVLIVVTEGDA
jgi:diaminopropionate ammonia-lyase